MLSNMFGCSLRLVRIGLGIFYFILFYFLCFVWVCFGVLFGLKFVIVKFFC